MPALNLPDMQPSIILKPGYLQHSLCEEVAGKCPPLHIKIAIMFKERNRRI
jgi:hypothetical protein